MYLGLFCNTAPEKYNIRQVLVHQHVFDHVTFLCEAPTAHSTDVRSLSRVDSQVTVQVTPTRKLFLTKLAGEVICNADGRNVFEDLNKEQQLSLI
ncbi:hypothetical protein DPMN_021612 [Dreissena polymorpha]|uniref:Uncharacterized protein n=1 Tax=Dreissena polymorpha TaxID=45954 RepID=A0A9D4NPA9_DREPO|nr:hypothetical protein DPMN_021612 [Dreissena polymorpha]